jgi:hypothetical protein
MTLSFLLLIFFFFNTVHTKKTLYFQCCHTLLKVYKVKVYILNGRRCDEHLITKFEMNFSILLIFF